MYKYPIITITYPNGNVTNIDTNNAIIQNLFNENYFRANLANSNFLQALDQGISNRIYLDTYDFWARVGIKAGLSASPYYNEAAYLANNPDVAALVKGQSITPDDSIVVYDSALQHWLIKGRDEVINGFRLTAAYPSAYTFTAVKDNFVAYPYVGGVFTGTDQTFRVGDVADGGTASLSTLVLTLNGGNSGAATITNIGTINCIVALASGGSVDATNFSDVTTIRSIRSIGTLTIGNLNLNPTLIIDYSSNLTVNYVDAVLSGNNKTFNLNVSAISSANIVLNNTNSGFFSTLAITSAGAIADTITSLSGTAIMGASVLDIKGTQSLTMTVHSSISTIRTITAVPKASIIFSDNITGTAGNILTATFSTPGSSVRFTGTQTLAATNKLNFTGTGNTLSIRPITEAAISSNIGALFTNLDILDINGQLASGSVIVATNYGSNINTVNLNGLASSPPILGATVISSLPAGATINLGMSSTPITGLTGTLTIGGAGGGVTVNILGINPLGAVTEGLSFLTYNTLTMNISSLAILSAAFNIAVSGTALTTLNITGGNAGSTATLNFGGLPNNIITVNAADSLTGITIVSGTGNDNIIGGTGNDTITASGGINTIRGHANLGSTATDINTYIISSAANAITTITDFNAASSSTSVDKLQFALNQGISSFGVCMSGNGVALGAVAANLATWSSGATFQFTSATNNILKYTVANVANAAALVPILSSKVTLFSGVSSGTLNGFPIIYSNGNDARIALFQWGTTTNTISASPVVSDLVILTGVLLDNIDATDFGSFF
jgi:hypothetical protein